MSRYSLILHGALELGDEARAKLKELLTGEVPENALLSLPSTIATGLTIAEAEQRKQFLESRGADIELIVESDEFEGFGSAEVASTEVEDDAESLLFSFDIDDGGRTVKEEPRSSSDTVPAAPTISFELEGGDEPVETPEVQMGTAPTVSGITFTSEPEDTTETPGVTLSETVPSETPAAEDGQAGEVQDSESPIIGDGNFNTPPLEGWKPQSIRRSEAEMKSALINRYSVGASALIFVAMVYLLINRPEPPPEIALTIPVEQLVGKPIKPDGQSNTPAAVAKKSTTTTTLPPVFERFWRDERTENGGTLLIRVGLSKLGYDIREFTLEFAPPKPLTQRDYMQGRKEEPWLRRFTAEQNLPTRSGGEEGGESLVLFNRSMSGRAVVEYKGESYPLVGVISMNTSYNKSEGVMSGFWEVRSSRDPGGEKVQKNTAWQLPNGEFAFAYYGDFTAREEAKAEEKKAVQETTP